jgi:hypothetical protein
MSEPVKQYFGLLASISEAADIQKEMNCTAERAYEIQVERAEGRMLALREAEEAAPSNVIQFRPKGG